MDNFATLQIFMLGFVKTQILGFVKSQIFVPGLSNRHGHGGNHGHTHPHTHTRALTSRRPIASYPLTLDHIVSHALALDSIPSPLL